MKDFLKKLESNISILSESERKKVLKKYKEQIEKNIANGMSETEAIEALGSLDDVVNSIYDEYHIDGAYAGKDKNFGETINGWITSLAALLSTLCREVSSHVQAHSKENQLETFFEVMLKIILLIMAFMILKLPFIILEELFTVIFHLLFYPFNIVLVWVLQFILAVVYFVCCIILAVAMFKGYYQKEDKEGKPVKKEKEEGKVEKVAEVKEATNYLFVIIKIVLYIIIIIPMIFLNLAFLSLAVLAGFLVYKGVDVPGLAIILFGLFLLTTTLTKSVTDALDGKSKTHIFSLGVSVIAIFIGSILFVDNLLNFNYPNNLAASHFKPIFETQTIEIKNPTAITYGGGEVTYKIDNSMIDNEILLEITYYDKVVDMQIDIVKRQDAKKDYIILYTSDRHLRLDTAAYLYDNALADLTDSNIFNYKDLRRFEITIYCNETTKELIQ